MTGNTGDFRTYSNIVKMRYDNGKAVEEEIKSIELAKKGLEKIRNNLLYDRPDFMPSDIDALRMSRLGELMDNFEKAGFELPKEDRWIKNDYDGKFFNYRLDYSKQFSVNNIKTYPFDERSKLWGGESKTLRGDIFLVVGIEGQLFENGATAGSTKYDSIISSLNKGKSLSNFSHDKFSISLGEEGKKYRNQRSSFDDHIVYIDRLNNLIRDIQSEDKKLFFS